MALVTEWESEELLGSPRPAVTATPLFLPWTGQHTHIHTHRAPQGQLSVILLSHSWDEQQPSPHHHHHHTLIHTQPVLLSGLVRVPPR